MRTISIVSRVRCTGRENSAPCHPSITCGPLVPNPNSKRPFEIACTPIAFIASIAGVRAPICAMPVPNLIRSVTAAIAANGVNASNPQNSAVHTDDTPRPSASRA